MVFSSSPLPQWLVPSASVSFDSMVLELTLLGYLLFVRQRSKQLTLTLPRCLAPNSDNLLTYGWKLSWPETFCLVLGPRACHAVQICLLLAKQGLPNAKAEPVNRKKVSKPLAVQETKNDKGSVCREATCHCRTSVASIWPPVAKRSWFPLATLSCWRPVSETCLAWMAHGWHGVLSLPLV